MKDFEDCTVCQGTGEIVDSITGQRMATCKVTPPKKKEQNVYSSKTYLVREHPFAYATCTNFGNGMGLLQIHSDWGAFSAFWPAMGDGETVENFVATSEMGYIRGCLVRGLNFQYFKRGAEDQLNRFMIECWPRLAKLIEKEQTPLNDGERS